MIFSNSTMKMWMKCGVLVLVLLTIGLKVQAEIDDDDVTVEEESVQEEAPQLEEIPYKTPTPIGNAYLAEHFDDRSDFEKRWIKSEAKKDGTEETIAKYDGKWELEEAEKNALNGDLGLVLKSKAHHHAISARLDKPFLFDNKPFVLQYEVHFQNGMECGGAYMKVISQSRDLNLRNFHDKTPYTIMFGPDKCGNDHKLHFIFRHRNPKNGTFTEKHWKKTSHVPKLEDIFKDKKPHLFTLVLSADNQFEVLMDRKSLQKGSLFEEFTPPVNPPSEIDDLNDKKPDEWDEREKIPDSTAVKPEDWDEDAPREVPDANAQKPSDWLDEEPELISDPSANKPEDWDDEMDGEWEPPLITNPKCEKVGCGLWKPPLVDNPNYKGKWKPPVIENPNYKGKWKPRRIPNPDYFEDKNPYKMTPIGAVGFELWSMTENIIFDNVMITDDITVADQWTAETWALKKEIADRETDNVIVRLVKYTNKYPWLWAVYIVAIGLPVVLFISFCCTTSTKEKDAAARRKKTDESMPDEGGAKEVKKEVRINEHTHVIPSASQERETLERSSSQDADEDVEEEDLELEEDEVQEDEAEAEDLEKDEVDKEEKEQDDNTEEQGSGDVRRSPRKRRARRE